MKDYQSQTAFLLGPMAQAALARVFESVPDLVVSLDAAEVTNKMVAQIRLLPVIEGDIDLYQFYKKLLAELLRDEKITIASYGISRKGADQLEDLLRGIGALPPAPEPIDPAQEVIDAVRAMDIQELHYRIANDVAFAAKYRQCVVDGRFV